MRGRLRLKYSNYIEQYMCFMMQIFIPTQRGGISDEASNWIFVAIWGRKKDYVQINSYIGWFFSAAHKGKSIHVKSFYTNWTPDEVYKYININSNQTAHNDVIRGKHLPPYWSIVREIHPSSADSPHKCQWRGMLMQSRRQWFETPSRQFWRLSNGHGEKGHEYTNTLIPLLRHVPALLHFRLLKTSSCQWDKLLQI